MSATEHAGALGTPQSCVSNLLTDVVTQAERGVDRPGEQGDDAGEGSSEETGLTNAITPKFSILNNRLQL